MPLQTDESPIKALILEDAPLSAMLLVKTLEREGLSLEHLIIDSRDALESVLTNFDCDIVLSDYYMPNLDCQEALQLIRAVDREVPFVLVSGKIGEETVVSMMKAGATDFVMKDRLDRLMPVVSREIQNARVRQERLRVQEDLRRTESEFQTFIAKILEVIPDGLVVMDEHQHPFLSNHAFQAIVERYASRLGYTEDELKTLLIEQALQHVHSESGSAEIRIGRKSE